MRQAMKKSHCFTQYIWMPHIMVNAMLPKLWLNEASEKKLEKKHTEVLNETPRRNEIKAENKETSTF